VCIVSLLNVLLLENLFCRPGVVFSGVSVVVESVSSPRWGLCFFLSFYFFLLCVSLISLDIWLVQRSGIIDTFVILIYSFY
jgi:hypothetical protein